MHKPDNQPLSQLTTEGRSTDSMNLDRMTAAEIVQLMNAQDAAIAAAVAEQSDVIARAIVKISQALQNDGRLIYMGAGTSGRLGVLDAVECPPTFNSPPEQVIGLIAGGAAGLIKAVEGAEDSTEQGADDLAELGLTARDVVVGIAASGRTPYVLGGLDYARKKGAFTIGFSCNKNAELQHHAELSILPEVGPEVLSGSTRLKAGTATKMVLNMLTTGAMVLTGKAYSNLMVDVQATNEKLEQRALRMVNVIAGCDADAARSALEKADGEVKTAVIIQQFGLAAGPAREHLALFNGHLRLALESPPAEDADQ